MNANSKHTPGPWKATRRYPNAFQVFADNVHICEIDHWGVRQTDLTSDLKPEGEPEANARLIAAAPELLEGCKAMLPLVDGLWRQLGESEECARAVESARAAITKAMGE